MCSCPRSPAAQNLRRSVCSGNFLHIFPTGYLIFEGYKPTSVPGQVAECRLPVIPVKGWKTKLTLFLHFCDLGQQSQETDPGAGCQSEGSRRGIGRASEHHPHFGAFQGASGNVSWTRSPAEAKGSWKQRRRNGRNANILPQKSMHLWNIN